MSKQRQDPGNRTLGAVIRHEQLENGLKFITEEASLSIEVWAAGTVRVKAMLQGQYDDGIHYAISGQPAPTQFQWEELDEHFELVTDQLKVAIQKSPLRLTFCDLQGQLLNTDDPAFGISWQGERVTNYKQLQAGERFLGLGEKTGGLDRRGVQYENWNTDQFAYGGDSDPLYVSIPFYLGVLDHRCYGLYFNNTYRSRFNFGAANDRFTFFQADGGLMDYFFFHAPTLPEVVTAYTGLTGRIALPPMWSLGFQQSRYSYYPDSEVLRLTNTFREKEIPADVIYLDIHYMERYKVFTWDGERFPDPVTMIARLREKGFHVVVILDPGIKKEAGYGPYEDGMEKNVFARYPDGEHYTGSVWPGACHFPDFTRPNTRNWWGAWLKGLAEAGVEGFWNDMNEPAVWGKHFPDLVEFDFEGAGATHRRTHNVYGLQMARSTYEGARNQFKGKRPFVLTRSGFSGIQRHAAVWTGDNVSSGEGLLTDVHLVNSLGLSGVAFAGCDVGGFVGEASSELFNRWIAIGAFSPFFRCHSMINSRAAEPWAFGEESEEIARNYIRLRYRLLPYLYATFYEAFQTGLPVQRSLALDYTYDPKVYDGAYQHQYLFGAHLLVAPVVPGKEYAKVYLPEGEWYDLFNDQFFTGKQEIVLDCPKDKLPVFVKAGGIVALQNEVQYTSATVDPVLELHLYQGQKGVAWEYYEDDGESEAYAEGEFYRRMVHYNTDRKRLEIGAVEGTYLSKFRAIKLYLHGFDANLKAFRGATELPLHRSDYRFVAPLSNFDPWEYAEDRTKVIEDLPSLVIEWEMEAFFIRLEQG